MKVGDDVSRRTADSPQQATWNILVPKYGEGQGCFSLTLFIPPNLTQVTVQGHRPVSISRASALHVQPCSCRGRSGKPYRLTPQASPPPPWTKPPRCSRLGLFTPHVPESTIACASLAYFASDSTFFNIDKSRKCSYILRQHHLVFSIPILSLSLLRESPSVFTNYPLSCSTVL